MSLERHPDPPADFNRRTLPVTQSAGPWIRSYSLARDPLYFSRAGGRFDGGPDFGVCYAALDEHGAFIETFGHTTGTRFVEKARLVDRGIARIEARRELELVRLAGPGFAQLGGDARLATGDYSIAQRWAAAIHGHPSHPGGILYPSRHDPERFCVGLFDRVASDLVVTPLGAWGAHTRLGLVAAILDAYDFALID